VRRLNADVEGVIDVAGPELAGSLTDLGLVDEYRLYVRPENKTPLAVMSEERKLRDRAVAARNWPQTGPR